MKKARLLAVLLVPVIVSCATEGPSPGTGAAPEVPSHEGIPAESYRIATVVYDGNGIGRVERVSGYRMEFDKYKLADGSYLFDMHAIEMAASKEGADPVGLEWVRYGKFDRFPVVVQRDLNLAGSRAWLDRIPHDDMDSYYVYVTLMDILMYERYREIAWRMIGEKTERAVEPSRNEMLPDWKPLITEIDFPDSRETVLELAGSNPRGQSVFLYKQDGTLIRQTIHLNGMTIGTEGTTRFMGTLTLDPPGALARASMFEYFAMKVNVLLVINIDKLVKREQVIERIE